MPPAKTRGLTPGEKDALAAYAAFTEEHGEPPSARQLGDELGITGKNAYGYIIKLREKGYLTSRPVTVIRPTLTRKGKRA